MTATALAPIVIEDKREAALMKAIGLDKVPVEQRELAVHIAQRYELDLMLKHLVLIDGRPYVTRDGLLHIAHRSGQFDGMEVSDPEVITIEGRGTFWTARCSVYRKDMSRPFTYAGRYPTSGGNQRYAPEMAVKVSEVMSLRRAFDVSAPVLEERWDLDAAEVPAPEPPKSTREAIREARVALEATTSGSPQEVPAAEPDAEAAGTEGPSSPEVPAAKVQCDSTSDPAMGDVEQCRREMGHTGAHRTPDQSWPR